MKHKIISFTLFLYLIATVAALASDWVLFFNNPKNDAKWLYDREGIYYNRDKEIIFGLMTIKDKNFPKVWFKSVQQGKERRLAIEMDCNGRSGSLYNDKGNMLYSDDDVDYSFGNQFWPDSIMNALYKEVCHPNP